MIMMCRMDGPIAGVARFLSALGLRERTRFAGTEVRPVPKRIVRGKYRLNSCGPHGRGYAVEPRDALVLFQPLSAIGCPPTGVAFFPTAVGSDCCLVASRPYVSLTPPGLSLRTLFFVKDSPQGPLGTSNRQPPTATNRQPPPTASHQEMLNNASVSCVLPMSRP